MPTATISRNPDALTSPRSGPRSLAPAADMPPLASWDGPTSSAGNARSSGYDQRQAGHLPLLGTLDRPQHPLLRHGGGRAQELGEQAHPEFLDHPANLRQVRIRATGGGPVKGLMPGGGDPGDRVHMVGVGGEVAGEAVEAVGHRPDVAEHVGEPGTARGGDPAGVDEGVELGADVLDGGGEGGVGQGGEAALDLGGHGQDPFDERDHVEGGGGEAGPDRLEQALEPLLVPGGSAVGGDQVVGGGG